MTDQTTAIKLTPALLDLLASVEARDGTNHITMRFIGSQVCWCGISDPRFNGGVTAAEMDELENWDVKPSRVRRLVKLGLLKLAQKSFSPGVGWLQGRYEFYELTDEGRTFSKQGAPPCQQK